MLPLLAGCAALPKGRRWPLLDRQGLRPPVAPQTPAPLRAAGQAAGSWAGKNHRH